MATLKDKRVVNRLRSIGVADADIYYSPISIWIIAILYLLPGGFFIIHIFASIGHGWILLVYGVLSYVINAYHNNSFAFHQNSLIAVNPNFPFQRTDIINIVEIEQIAIDKSNRKWTPVFLLFGENYVSIKTKGRVTKYYCSGLDLDGYDEGFTERTIEDFHAKLKEKGIPTHFNLKHN